MKEAKYDAILVHGYQIRGSRRDPEKFRSSLRGHMQVSSAHQLIREMGTSAIFLAVGPVWGKNYPAFAGIMERELKTQLARSKTQSPEIIVKPIATTTHEEIDLFLAEAQKRGWKNLANLANKTHHRRIRAIYQKRGKPDIEIINAEDVLDNVKFKDRTPYRHFLKAFKWSNKEIIFKAKEFLVTTLYKLGFENYLTEIAKRTRVQKSKDWFDS